MTLRTVLRASGGHNLMASSPLIAGVLIAIPIGVKVSFECWNLSAIDRLGIRIVVVNGVWHLYDWGRGNDNT